MQSSSGTIDSKITGKSGEPSIQELRIHVPKNGRKKYHMMRFNSVLGVDFGKWSQVKMERENNQKEFKGQEEEQPKFGAGSEFGREAKEEARRKKYGINTKKYRPEDQPWIIKVGGKTGKKFKGIREGGVGENAAYYIFIHGSEGQLEAYPLSEWYNFQPIARYKALSAEEAEQEFGRRKKSMNYFSLMLRKRLRNCDDGDMEEEETKGKKSFNKSKELKISEMDEWVDTDLDDSDDEEEQDEEAKEKKDKKKKKKKKKGAPEKNKKKKGSDDSAVEESDDGDEEGRECDYISDSSDSASDPEGKIDKEMKSVAEESALRKLLTSDDEDDEEEKEAKKSDNEENQDGEDAPSNSNSAKKKKKKVKKDESSTSKKNEEEESSSDFSPDSSDSEIDSKAKQLQQLTPTQSGSASKTPSCNDTKRSLTPSGSEPPFKKSRIDTPSTPISGSNDSGITEEAVRRYLMRKPMTATELLQKFKSRKTGLNSDQLVNVMTQILKKINPLKQTIKNKMYLSLK